MFSIFSKYRLTALNSKNIVSVLFTLRFGGQVERKIIRDDEERRKNVGVGDGFVSIDDGGCLLFERQV